ncbi:M15 family metallopeptidase [Phaeovulum sp.]|uniref:M15 family metallopeptidase n=1 Tax=Phaeovulum sp. TaxID=2934796 RepID=UPI0039E560FD
MARLWIKSVALFISTGSFAAAQCHATDYLALPILSITGDFERAALSLAYPDISFSTDDGLVSADGLQWIEFGAIRDIHPQQRLAEPSVIEQFVDIYPLSFNLSGRKLPYFDPGRVRNDAFFRSLYFQSAENASASLVAVSEPTLTNTVFRVTGKRNVACQLAAVLKTLASTQKDYSAVFSMSGGGYNWRVISGTDRLSPHSFGVAVDVNPGLGQYWKWTGATEGNVGAYNNRIPAEVVMTFERYGFIWGGKWHHFDGMHFEFRPELILYARLVSVFEE